LLIQPYLNSANIAQQAGKPFLMFETNTASCGGFPGISDSYGAALWALDYGLQMAYSNFSGGMFHLGGQNVYYNPFIPPPTNQSTFHQWTVGPVYYASLIIAEAFGSTNTSQIIDLFANGNNMYTPAYAIYESGTLAKVALFNFITDPSGATAYTASLSISGGAPASVQVKYLSAASVSQKGNITWAGQTFGNTFESDGRLKGTLDVQTVACDQNANTCPIQVPAPGFALVFINSQVLSEVSNNPSTFATSQVTKTHNTATIDPSVLATSNGHSGSNRELGGTSKGLKNGAVSGRTVSAVGCIAMLGAAMGWGAVMVWNAMLR